MTTTEINLLGFRFNLERHEIDEPPASKAQEVGYVRFAGSRTIKVALWKAGRWVDDKGPPIPVCAGVLVFAGGAAWQSVRLKTSNRAPRTW